MTTPMTKEAINTSMLSSLEGYVAYVVDSLEFELKRELTSEEQQTVFRHVESIVDGTALEAKDKRVAELENERTLSMTEMSRIIQQEGRKCREAQSRAESVEQRAADLESRTITVTLPAPECAADFVLPVAVYTQETIIDCLASHGRITLQIQGGENVSGRES